MALDIRDLSRERVSDNTKYFFDTNIWLSVLSTQFTLRGNTKPYLNFFEAVSKHNKNTKVVLTSFLLSEIINRYLRDITMKKFAAKRGDANFHSSYFKMVYRQDAQYAIDYELLCDDIKAFHNSLEFVPDEFGIIFKAKDILKSPPKGLDFNDHLTVKLCHEKKFVIVTDDSDFVVEDLPIITLNKDLLAKMQPLS